MRNNCFINAVIVIIFAGYVWYVTSRLVHLNVCLTLVDANTRKEWRRDGARCTIVHGTQMVLSGATSTNLKCSRRVSAYHFYLISCSDEMITFLLLKKWNIFPSWNFEKLILIIRKCSGNNDWSHHTTRVNPHSQPHPHQPPLFSISFAYGMIPSCPG